MSFQQLEKKRGWFQQMLLLGGSTLVLWGVIMIGMNYSAYAQIWQFKWQNLLQAQSIEPSAAGTKSEPNLASLTNKEFSAENLVSNKKITERPFQVGSGVAFNPRRYAKKVFNDWEVIPADNRIVIPRIQKNIPLVNVPSHQNWYQLEDNIQQGLREGVVIHPMSHAPGNWGNFFVTGHSSYYQWDPGRFKDVFALLHELKIGDRVEVYWEGRAYVYEITTEKVVSPFAVEILNQPKDRSIITLMTCTPIGTNRSRLVFTGVLVDELGAI